MFTDYHIEQFTYEIYAHRYNTCTSTNKSNKYTSVYFFVQKNTFVLKKTVALGRRCPNLYYKSFTPPNRQTSFSQHIPYLY